MFAVLAEDRSDVDALVILIRRIIGTSTASIRKKGFGGCGELRRKAWSHIKDFANEGATRFIICHDSDGNNPAEIKKKVIGSITAKINLPADYVIVVPVQELEAWMIADEAAIRAVIPSLAIAPVARPELIDSPKEWLIGESKRGRSRPLYIPTAHNDKVAAHLDVARVRAKCPSFGDLVDFVKEEGAYSRTDS